VKGQRYNTSFWAGRMLALVLLALALLDIELPTGTAQLGLTVLADDSYSMPAGFVDERWRMIATEQSSLPTGSVVQLLRFAAAAVSEESTTATERLPRSLPMDKAATDIANALQQALYQLPASGTSSVLLISDGAATQGDTLQQLEAYRQAHIPVFIAAPPAATGTASLVRVSLPPRLTAGQAFTLGALVRGEPGETVQLSVLLQNRTLANRQVTLAANGENSIEFSLEPLPPGLWDIKTQLNGGTAYGSRYVSTISVTGHRPTLLISQGNSAVKQLLSTVDPNVISIAPQLFRQRLDLLHSCALVVLDNIAIAQLLPSDWRALASAVRTTGLGLLVLGGDRSFSVGAYRHSLLEDLLPVTAEASTPQPPAAVVFLLDSSGSMARPVTGPTHFELAMQALHAAMRQLTHGDQAAVVSFADQPVIQLAMSPAREHRQATLALEPNGSTQLGAALELALSQLQGRDVEQKLLVLVSDGYADQWDRAGIAQRLRQAGVTVIALAVGADPGLAELESLTGFNNGRLLQIERANRLPQLLSAQMAKHRSPPLGSATPVVQVEQLPFQQNVRWAWPPLASYNRTRLREGSTQYLQSASGDPLFALGFAGVGRVAVLPGGLGQWADGWKTWGTLANFLRGTLGLLGQVDGGRELWLQLLEQNGELVTVVDRVDQRGWSFAPPRMQLQTPDGQQLEPGLVMRAPGRFVSHQPLTSSGRYEVTVQGTTATLRGGWYRNEADDWVEPQNSVRQLQSWIDDGLLRPWPGLAPFVATLPRQHASIRPALIALALLTYLLTLLDERGLLSQLTPSKNDNPPQQ
jgi:Ca-activated chloride channel homolog